MTLPSWRTPSGLRGSGVLNSCVRGGLWGVGGGRTYGAGGGSGALDGLEWDAMMASLLLFPRGFAVTLSDARIETRM